MTLPPELARSLHFVGSLRGVPHYALALAEVVTAASALDFRFVVVFATVTGTPLPVIERALGEMPNTIGRIKALRAMNRDFAPDDAFRVDLATLLDEAEPLARRRAALVHGYWIVRGDGAVFLTNFKLPHEAAQRDRPVALSELTELSSAFWAIHERMQKLILPLLAPPPA